MMKRLKPHLKIVAGAGIALFIVVAFIASRPMSVEVAPTSRNVPVQVFGLGTVEARILSKVGFEVGATIIELSADQGDHVKKGDVLARLYSAEQEARLAKARAGMGHANAKVMMANVAVGKAKAVLAQKIQTNRRKQALLSQRTISIEAAEESQLEVDVASADLAVSVRDVDVAKAALLDAKAQYTFEQVLFAHHTLKAPYDAIVVERHMELGAVLNPGVALFTLVAPETVWVRAHIDEARAGNIQLGQVAEVRLRSLPHNIYKGQVSRIDIESDRVTEERRVYVTCEPCAQNFHLGEQAEVFITTSILKEARLVPEIAVQQFDGTKGLVWTVEDGTLHRRELSFGNRTLDSMLEVVHGLPQGAQVVTTLVPKLEEGRSAKAIMGEPQ